MSTGQKDALDRRTFMTGAAAMGGFASLALGAGAGPAHAAVKRIPGASIRGPYLDLTTSFGTMTGYARLSGNIDLKSTTHGWYEGLVMGVAPGGAVRDICGFRGMSSYRLVALPDGEPGYRRLLREVVYYYDLKTGEVMDEMVNPFTGEKVRVVDIANDPFNHTIREYLGPPPDYGGLNPDQGPPARIPFLLDWQQDGDRLLTSRHIHLYYRSALQPDKWPRESAGENVQVSELFFFNMSLDDMQNEELTTVRHGGTWTRVTPWLPWMLMGQAPGHCLYLGQMASVPTLADVPEHIVRDTERRHPEYLTAPDSDYGPNLSSLEMYAIEQEPAPPRTP